MPPAPPARSGRPEVGIAFLLAQLGSYATKGFVAALAEYDVNPPLLGIMRILLTEPSPSQQQLAERLGMVPSRMVALVDDLEARGWIARTRDTVDRRINVLTATDAGREMYTALAVVAGEHEQRVTAPLDDAERGILLELLGKLAAAAELSPGVHPGYRSL